MNITYVSSFDATDITSYSGTGYYIPHKLKEYGNQLYYIDQLGETESVFQRMKRKLYSISGKKYLIDRNPVVLNKWARKIQKSMPSKTDIILGYSSQPFARLDSVKPMVFWSDAVFANMVDYYEVYSNLCQESLFHGNQMEQLALENVNLAVFSSDWAANAAKKYYNVPDSKIKVIPYGANIDVDHDLEDIHKMASNKKLSPCKLLFLATEWDRKGGDIAVEVARVLIKSGIKTELHIIGVEVVKEVEDEYFVKAHGYLNKSVKMERILLNKVISESHFLVLPTRADCTPIVFNEFNAHGIPVISTNEGGIPSIIKNGRNGFLFEKDMNAEKIALKIIDLLSDRKSYIDLAKSSFNEYQTRLNWKVSINEFQKLLNSLR